MQYEDVEISMFPAQKGDCILIYFKKENFRVLIDGGFASTYTNFLKPYLVQLAVRGEKINLLIVTHIDHDHIAGIKKLLNENGDANKPNIIQIDEIWFNGFRHIKKIHKTNKPIPYIEKCVLQNMSQNNIDNQTEETEYSDISYSEGSSLAELIATNGYNWNSSLFNKPVTVENYKYVNFGNINFEILNPTQTDLDNLGKYWIWELEKNCREYIVSDDRLFNQAFEGNFISEIDVESVVTDVSCSMNKEINWELEAEKEDEQADRKVANLSSIAFLIRYKHVTLLFLGDCPLEHIKSDLPEKIDIVKLPHHGSGKSINKHFIRTKDVAFYLLSTDGEAYNHPSKVIIGNILCKTEHSIIIKNYDIPMLQNIGILDQVGALHEYR